MKGDSRGSYGCLILLGGAFIVPVAALFVRALLHVDELPSYIIGFLLYVIFCLVLYKYPTNEPNPPPPPPADESPSRSSNASVTVPPPPPSSYHQSSVDFFAIAHGWNVSKVTEYRACTTVNTPIPMPNKSGRYIFSSKASPGVSYITSMLACTCPAYTTGKTRPCKHMVRLALFRGYYDIRFPENRAHGNIQFDGSHGDDVNGPPLLFSRRSRR